MAVSNPSRQTSKPRRYRRPAGRPKNYATKDAGRRRPTNNVTGESASTAFAIELMSVMKTFAEQQGKMVGILKFIDERLEEQDPSRKPIPRAPESSSSAWNPLLHSTMENLIKPNVDRWRGTLDTLLVFVALFSAVVTSFLVQASAGLSQDSGSRTNELVANLTEIIIQLSDLNASSLDLARPTLFEPDSQVVRLNVYWSISLIASLCIASLAVVGRGYLASLTRYRRHHTQAHEKLVELSQRWKLSDSVLRPMVEALPQMLVLAVMPFVFGLLDSLLSSALALAPPSLPVLAAGVVTSVFAGLTGITIICTIIHGCVYPSTSPFQTILSPFFERRGRHPKAQHSTQHSNWWTTIIYNFRQFFGPVMALFSRFNVHITNSTSPYLERARNRVFQTLLRHFGDRPTSAPWAGSEIASPASENDRTLSLLDLETYHTTLLLTHDDDSVDRAVAALWNVIFLMRHHHNDREGKSEKMVVRTLRYLLSPECSRRAGLEAASVIMNIYSDKEWPTFSDDHEIELNVALCRAIERDRIMAVGNTSWKQFWDSAYFKALLGLIQENSWPDHVPDFVRTLFVTSLPSDSPNILDFIKMQALRALHHYLYDDSRHGGTSDEAIDDLLYPLLELRNQNKLHIDSPQTMTVLLDFSTRSYAGTLQTISADRRSYDALVDLFCWLSRNGFETFVEVALQADRLDDLVKQRNQPIIHGLLQAVAQFEELFPSLDSNAYANILASMISLTRSSIAMVDDEGYPDSNIIHYERDIVNVLKCVAEQEQRIRFDADIYDACVKICILLAKDAPRYQHGKRPFYYVDKPESDAEVENGARVSLLEAFRYLLERNGYRLTVIKPAGIAHLIPSQYQISVQTVLSSGDVLGPSMQ